MWSLGVSLYAMSVIMIQSAKARELHLQDHVVQQSYRLSGRLPFDVEEDCSKHQLLIAMINKGFTAEVSAGLGAKVSLEARLLVSQLLTVRPDLRIKVVQQSKPLEVLGTMRTESCIRQVKLQPAPGSPRINPCHLFSSLVTR